MKGYKQYNLESICMKAGHLVLAANVITGTGKAEDRFSVLNGITYEKGTYSFNCALAKGMKVDNKEIGNIKTTNFGALAFDENNQKLYGIKAGTNGEYKEPSKCAAAIWEFEDYTSSTKGVKRLANKVVPGEKRCLYHANGMDIYNHELYVTCAEPNGKGEYSVVKLTMGSTSEEWPYNRYTWENRTNAISHYKGNQLFFLPKPVQRVKKIKKYINCVLYTSQQEKLWLIKQNIL